MFLHNKKSSTTLNLPFPGVLGANSKSPSPKSTKRKEKNVNKRSYIIKKTPPLSIYFFQESWAPIPRLQVRNLQKERKRTLINVLT